MDSVDCFPLTSSDSDFQFRVKKSHAKAQRARSVMFFCSYVKNYCTQNYADALRHFAPLREKKYVLMSKIKTTSLNKRSLGVDTLLRLMRRSYCRFWLQLFRFGLPILWFMIGKIIFYSNLLHLSLNVVLMLLVVFLWVQLHVLIDIQPKKTRISMFKRTRITRITRTAGRASQSPCGIYVLLIAFE